MFGFPFITSIIVMMLLVTLVSVIVNKGFNAATGNRRGLSNYRKDKTAHCHG